LQGFTPSTNNLPVGVYNVELNLPGYDTSSFIVPVGTKPGDRTSLFPDRSIDLVRSTGVFELRTMPSEKVKYEIIAGNRNDDADTSGTADLTINRFTLPTGAYKVKLSYSGYQTNYAFEIAQGKHTELTGYLPFGYLTVNSDPPGARIKFLGKEIGVTPYTNINDLGTGTLELTRDHYRTLSTNVTVPLQQICSVNLRMTPSAGPAIGDDWTNSLGMRFVPLRTADGKMLFDGRLLFCIWETRWKDFEKFAIEDHFPGSSWKTPFKERDKGNYMQSECDPV